ncbi:Ig-like domain-containing protein [Paenibacillus flagellatus]|uniref:BIG2 domain-containing protein n=1 Tax=Paenibacillus flagellatus TaxID=2211139 RepID=A0A2V5KGD6_9BACL|nr:Ig-like domain-containing protein [Paenibacillus flagellatus]PYI57383.1 hypothetical protein DLM86_02800 [Paenibacillus flagellatus]
MKSRWLTLVVAIALLFGTPGFVRSAGAQEGGAIVTDLGTPITGVVTVMTSAFGVENGRNVMYTVVQADPAIFVTVDIDEEKVIRTMELPNAGGSWSQAVDTFGNVYIGTYGNGLLYRFEPATETLVNVGRAVGGGYVYGLIPGPNGKMYGGTYPNGKVFEYDPSTNAFTDFGVMQEGELYVRGLAYEPDRNVLYAGTGSHGYLIEYDLATGSKRSVLPPEHRAGEPFLYDMNLAGHTLFVRKEKAKTMLAIDTATNAVLAEVPMISRSPSGKSPIANKVYYTYNAELMEYDLDTNTAKGLGVKASSTGVSYGFAQLKDPELPGYSLVGLAGNGGGFFKYSLETGKLKNVRLALPGAPKTLNAVVNGPDGTVHVGGYLTGGGISSYNPVTGMTIKTPGLSQVEGFGTLGDKVYAGVYPEAQLYEFDPVARKAAKLTSLVADGQERPYAVLGLEREKLIAIGTVAAYGSVEGALSLYDTASGQTQTFKNVVPNQSVLSLAYKDGSLYGGTTIYGGLGSQDPPPETEAKLFVFDVASRAKTYETVPVPGATAISGLLVGPDGYVWGFANGTLFVFDPQTRTVTYREQKFPYAGGREWRNAELSIGTDGNVYGLLNSAHSFFRIDASTKQLTVLNGDARTGLAQDDFGRFYFLRGTHLIQYADPGLTAGYTGGIELTASSVELEKGQRAALYPEALLEKGRRTRNVSSLTLEYVSDRPDVVSVGQDGTMTGTGHGTANVWVKVTFPDGRVAESEKLAVVSVDGSRLKELSLDGVPLAGFSPDVLEYDVPVPYGTTTPPTVAAVPQSAKSAVTVRQATYVPGEAAVQVESAFGAGRQTYTVRFSPATVTGIELAPFAPMKEGDRTTAVVQAVYSDGTKHPLTAGVAYASADPSVATVGPDGSVTARGQGETTIEATWNGMSATATVKVTTSILFLHLQPVHPIREGGEERASVTVRYRDGSTRTPMDGVSYTSDDPSVATVDATGLVQAHRKGVTTVRAEYGGRNAWSVVVVIPGRRE